MEVDEDKQLCKICKQQKANYTCPKCEICYCSLECYKSEVHSQCSEHFYKTCVEEELKLQESDPESRKKMIDILKRMKENMSEDLDFLSEDNSDDNESLDSDDDNNAEELEKRLEGVNLDDPDELWGALTDTERQEFEALVQNGDVDKFVPQWQPWWQFHIDKQLIQEVTQEEEAGSYVEKCPKIIQIPELKELSKSSPFIKFNIINVLYAYVYTTLYFNGEHMNNPKDSVYVFLNVCDNMRQNTVFKNEESAGEAVVNKLISNQNHSAESMLSTLKGAVDCILRGPTESNKSFYVKASLSELYLLFSKAKDAITGMKSKEVTTDFPKKFSSLPGMLNKTQFSKKDLQMCIKKLEYYLSWVNCFKME